MRSLRGRHCKSQASFKSVYSREHDRRFRGISRSPREFPRRKCPLDADDAVVGVRAYWRRLCLMTVEAHMPVTPSVQEFLRCADVAYTVLPHARAFTARTEAAAIPVPARNWAKVVVAFADG